MLPGVGVCGTDPDIRILVPILREFGFSIEAMWGKTLRDAEEMAMELKIAYFTNKIGKFMCCLVTIHHLMPPSSR